MVTGVMTGGRLMTGLNRGNYASSIGASSVVYTILNGHQVKKDPEILQSSSVQEEPGGCDRKRSGGITFGLSLHSRIIWLRVETLWPFF